MTCAKCGEDFIFPQNSTCPACGDPVFFRSADDFDPHAQTVAGAPTLTTQDGGREPDRFARRMVYVGLGFCASLLAVAYWDNKLLSPILSYLNLPGAARPYVRLLLAGLGLFGILQGAASLLTWRSDWRFYRRLRF